jgi:hypothetical protein
MRAGDTRETYEVLHIETNEAPTVSPEGASEILAALGRNTRAVGRPRESVMGA